MPFNPMEASAAAAAAVEDVYCSEFEALLYSEELFLVALDDLVVFNFLGLGFVLVFLELLFLFDGEIFPSSSFATSC